MNQWISALRIFIVLTILTGLVYPLAVTAIGRFVFPEQAVNSVWYHGATPIESDLIAQPFSDLRYFHARPSAGAYTTMPSSASNLGGTSADLTKQIAQFAKEWGKPISEIPADLITTSASGLDPHISPEAAYFQVDRIAKARGFTSAQIAGLNHKILQHIEPRSWGIFGQPRVNVLRLNLDLDQIQVSPWPH